MGSSSVGFMAMEKLAEAYQKTNKDITVEVQVEATPQRNQQRNRGCM